MAAPGRGFAARRARRRFKVSFNELEPLLVDSLNSIAGVEDPDEHLITPEAAADTVAVGDTIAVEWGWDERWAVVVRRQFAGLAWVLCRTVDRAWEVEDAGTMRSEDGVAGRSTWISVTGDDDPGANLGVEIAWGGAPAGATRVTLGRASDEVTVSVDAGAYWLVRWEVPDPSTLDDDDYDLETVPRFSSD
jgi:hypothetical protein